MLIPYEGERFKVSQTFKLGSHNGLDIVGLDGKKLLALCDGKIKQSRIVSDKSDRTWEWGNYVTLETEDGTQIIYAHLTERLVSAGQSVKRGDAIGVEGNTGYSFGSHCHLEVRNSANKVTASCNTPKFTGIPNILQTMNIEKESEDMTREETQEMIDASKEKVYHDWNEIKTELPWAYDDLLKLHEMGVFAGNSNTDLGVTRSEIKSLIWMFRLYDK